MGGAKPVAVGAKMGSIYHYSCAVCFESKPLWLLSQSEVDVSVRTVEGAVGLYILQIDVRLTRFAGESTANVAAANLSLGTLDVDAALHVLQMDVPELNCNI